MLKEVVVEVSTTSIRIELMTIELKGTVIGALDRGIISRPIGEVIALLIRETDDFCDGTRTEMLPIVPFAALITWALCVLISWGMYLWADMMIDLFPCAA